MPDLGHEELLAFRRVEFGRSSGGSGLDQHRLLALDRLVPQLVGDPVGSQQPARRPSHLIRDAVHRHAIDRQQEAVTHERDDSMNTEAMRKAAKWVAVSAQ